MNRALAALAVCLLAVSVSAQPPSIQIATVTGGLTEPILVTHAGDCSGRLFIVQQNGIVRIHDGTTLLPTPFINIGPTGLGLSSNSANSERGLLGMAFHPEYAENGFFYLSYTRFSGGASIISRWSVSAGNPNVAGTQETIILGPISQPEANHNGGNIMFGHDGMLYFGLGDGGGAGDNHGSIGNGQDTGTLLGKMLRIDVDGGFPYAIPPDNPFVGAGNPLDEIWAIGLRNPWRWSFDRRDGTLFLGDVGQGTREEIDIIESGLNYGWRRMEGTFCFNPGSGCQTGSLILPIFDYSSASPASECSVTGGYMYRGNASPTLDGTYIYGDYCSGRVWGLQETSPDVWTNTQMLDLTNTISSFGEDEFGELYICNHSGGAVSRIIGPTGVVRVTSPTPDGAYSEGATLSFTVHFNRIVNVTGTPGLLIDSGTAAAEAIYTSGTGSAILTFEYTVQATDSADDLDYLDTASLVLNGGTIQDGTAANASISLPAIGEPGSVSCGKALRIDNVDPAAQAVFAGVPNGTYAIGETITAVIGFDEDVNVSGMPRLALNVGGTTQFATYANGSGSNQLLFDYVVQEGDVVANLDYVDANAIDLNGGTITDFALNPAVLTLPAPGDPGSLGANSIIDIDGIRPELVAATASEPTATLGIGGSMNIVIETNENVLVTGTPLLLLETGDIDASASYTGMRGGSQLVFSYTVGEGEESSDLEYVSAAALMLNGGTIRDAAGNDAEMLLPDPGTLGSLGTNASIVVDGVRPRVVNVFTNLGNGTYGVGQQIDIFLEFNEPIMLAGSSAHTLTLETGDVDAIATFDEQTESGTMRFRYTVVQGDQSEDLDYASTMALALNGALIFDAVLNDASLDLPEPGGAGSLGANHDIVIVTPPIIRASGALSY